LEIRKRGRPKKHRPEKEKSHEETEPKKGRGRPKKIADNDPQAGAISRYFLNLESKEDK